MSYQVYKLSYSEDQIQDCKPFHPSLGNDNTHEY
jgi:hypothetical protein